MRCKGSSLLPFFQFYGRHTEIRTAVDKLFLQKARIPLAEAANVERWRMSTLAIADKRTGLKRNRMSGYSPSAFDEYAHVAIRIWLCRSSVNNHACACVYDTCR